MTFIVFLLLHLAVVFAAAPDALDEVFGVLDRVKALKPYVLDADSTSLAHLKSYYEGKEGARAALRSDLETSADPFRSLWITLKYASQRHRPFADSLITLSFNRNSPHLESITRVPDTTLPAVKSALTNLMRKQLLPVLAPIRIDDSKHADLIPSSFKIFVSQDFVFEYHQLRALPANSLFYAMYVRHDCVFWHNRTTGDSWEPELQQELAATGLSAVFSPFKANILAERQMIWEILAVLLDPCVHKVFEEFVRDPILHNNDPETYHSPIQMLKLIKTAFQVTDTKSLMSQTALDAPSLVMLIAESLSNNNVGLNMKVSSYFAELADYLDYTESMIVLYTETYEVSHDLHLANHLDHSEQVITNMIAEANGQTKLLPVFACKEHTFPTQVDNPQSRYRLIRRFNFEKGELALGIYMNENWANANILSTLNDDAKASFWQQPVEPYFTRPPLLANPFAPDITSRTREITENFTQFQELRRQWYIEHKSPEQKAYQDALQETWEAKARGPIELLPQEEEPQTTDESDQQTPPEQEAVLSTQPIRLENQKLAQKSTVKGFFAENNSSESHHKKDSSADYELPASHKNVKKDGGKFSSLFWLATFIISGLIISVALIFIFLRVLKHGKPKSDKHAGQ